MIAFVSWTVITGVMLGTMENTHIAYVYSQNCVLKPVLISCECANPKVTFPNCPPYLNYSHIPQGDLFEIASKSQDGVRFKNTAVTVFFGDSSSTLSQLNFTTCHYREEYMSRSTGILWDETCTNETIPEKYTSQSHWTNYTTLTPVYNFSGCYENETGYDRSDLVMHIQCPGAP